MLDKKQIVRSWSLALIGLLVFLLVACGGPEPTPQVIVVTRADTATPVTLVVTATFTPTPEPSPTEEVPTEAPPTEAPEPTVTLAPTSDAGFSSSPGTTLGDVPIEFEAYEHPTGAFSLDIPTDAERMEDDDGVYFSHGDSLVMIFFTVPDRPLSLDEMEEAVPLILDDALVGEGLILSYDNLETERMEEDNVLVIGGYTIDTDKFGAGEGRIILWQKDHVLYMLVMLTPAYDQIQEVWERALDSLTVFSSAVEAPEPPPTPTDTPLPPATNTPKPKPTNTPKPKPTNTQPPPPPPANANKGCYLFENYIDAELNVTFTSKDRPWSDSFKIPAMGTKEYCLDPGSYTYTIDAPPPWGSINGELVVNAGDRYRWPIRGN